jgi:DNA-binding NarL/FixJ family response regulator
VYLLEPLLLATGSLMTDQLAISQARDFNTYPIKVQLWIRSRLLREELVRLFGKTKDLAVVSATGEPEQVDRLSNEPVFDLRIADTFKPAHFTGLARTSDVRDEEFKLVLIGMSDSPEQFLRAVHAGVAGYLTNDASAAHILAAARAPFRGEVFCAPRLCLTLFNCIAQQETISPPAEQVSIPNLTLRQERLIGLVAKGLTNKEIACSLNLSEYTVRNHVHRILRKLQAGSRKEAVNVVRLTQRKEFSVCRRSINRADSCEAP